MKKLLTLIAALGVMSMFAISNAQAGGVGGHGFNKASSYSKMLRHSRRSKFGGHHRHGKKLIIKKVKKVIYKHGKKIVIIKVIKKYKKRRHGHKRHHGKRWVFKGHRAQRPCRPHSYRIVKHKGPKGHKGPRGPRGPMGPVVRKGSKGPGGQPRQNRRRT